MGFPENFLWGAASSAYQIEGAFNEDGKGTGIWDCFSEKPGCIAYGENGNVACDHYHRYKEDVALMKKMGLKSYRFSISWTRILPEGTGMVNQKGLQFYSDLVDELLGAGIEPLVTLYHWNLPMTLYEKGGWKNRKSPEWFREYTAVVVNKLSDRVKYWLTFNEFQVFAGIGLEVGGMVPFEQNSLEDKMEISRNLLLAHGEAVEVIRKQAVIKPYVGMSPTGDVWLPENDMAEAVEKAREKSFSVPEFGFMITNAWWADPIILGKFNEEAEKRWGELLPQFTEEEWNMVSAPLDFYGFNAYQGTVVYQSNKDCYPTYACQGSARTMTDWNVTPEVLYYAPKFLYERYKLPILITENGMAGMDWVSLDGGVHDMQRIDFLHRYLLELERAVGEGIPVLGYQHWSVMDNFEWMSGYDKRFGLIYIDYQSQKRILKDSAYWYRKVIESNGESLHKKEDKA